MIKDGTEEQFTAGGGSLNDECLSWSPDGQEIVFARGSGAYYNLYVKRVADSLAGAETALTSDSSAYNFVPYWSPYQGAAASSSSPSATARRTFSST